MKPESSTNTADANRVGSTGGSALTLACRLAEELRESDAAEYSSDEQVIMALYYELRRVQSLLRPWMLGESHDLRAENDRLRAAIQSLADEAAEHGEYNPIGDIVRLPLGYQKIIRLAHAALSSLNNPAQTPEGRSPGGCL